MSNDRTKKRQKSLERKQAKRKQAQARQRSRQPAGFRGQLQAAANWPLMECLVTREWQDTMQLTQVIVARRSPGGRVAAGVFLVDRACLGVKNAFARLFDSSMEYRQLREHILERQDLAPADLNLAAKLVRAGLDYARQLGFDPNPDYRDAAILLGNADPAACDLPVPVGGPEGKPFYVDGPYDNRDKIMNHLLRTLGPDGFNYMISVGAPPNPDDW